VYGGLLPSNHRRWCTKMLKLKPFENYIGDGPVINYVGLRADENQTGYISTKPNIKAVYPFQEDGLVRADIIRILEESSLGLPPYMAWGRSRSGCYFCFYQQKIEWVRLKEQHPDLFEHAKEYEERSLGFGEQFYWSRSESLAQLERPERIAEIKRNWEASEAKKRASRKNLALVETLGGLSPWTTAICGTGVWYALFDRQHSRPCEEVSVSGLRRRKMDHVPASIRAAAP
jgi:3'-phosphoadenosine 5'-phosphosulfate sulfotransferase (PAPS reductase)/FAD synthetase